LMTKRTNKLQEPETGGGGTTFWKLAGDKKRIMRIGKRADHGAWYPAYWEKEGGSAICLLRKKTRRTPLGFRRVLLEKGT